MIVLYKGEISIRLGMSLKHLMKEFYNQLSYANVAKRN